MAPAPAWQSDQRARILKDLIAFLSTTEAPPQQTRLELSSRSALRDLFCEMPRLQENEALLSRLLDCLDSESRLELACSICNHLFGAGRLDEALFVFAILPGAHSVEMFQHDARVLAASRAANGTTTTQLPEIVPRLLKHWQGSERHCARILQIYAEMIRRRPELLDEDMQRTAMACLVRSLNWDGGAAGRIVTTLLEAFDGRTLPDVFLESLGHIKRALDIPEAVKCALHIEMNFSDERRENANLILRKFLADDDIGAKDLRRSLSILKIRGSKSRQTLMSILNALRNALKHNEGLRRLFPTEVDMVHNLAMIVFLNRDSEEVQEVGKSILALTKESRSSDIVQTLYEAALGIALGRSLVGFDMEILEDYDYPRSVSSSDLMTVCPLLLCLHELAAGKSPEEHQHQLEKAIEYGIAEAKRRIHSIRREFGKHEKWDLEVFEEAILQHMLETGYAPEKVLQSIRGTMVEAIDERISDWLIRYIDLIERKEESPAAERVRNFLKDVATTADKGLSYLFEPWTLMMYHHHEMVQHLCQSNLECVEAMLYTAESLGTMEDVLEVLFRSALGARLWDKVDGFYKAAVGAEQRDRFSSELSKVQSSLAPVRSWEYLQRIQNTSLKVKTASQILKEVFFVLDNKGVHELSELLPYGPELQCQVLDAVLEQCSDEAALGFANHLAGAIGTG